ncbi:MAG: radical SAM protein [Oscillospiraceae bacterium]|nr:radical SAM protein [Oscillospiraceae bacterium]
MSNYKINSLYSGAGIIVTYKCSAACLHCCYSSSPKRSGDYMSKDTADKIFALLKKMGCYSVHIGGGEPFMNFDKLLEVCKSAREHNISIDYIETNASWFTDNISVSDKLKNLISAGVDCLLISIDPFHNEFVPYIKIKNLLKCCEKNGMGTFLWQSKFERIIRQLDEHATHSLSEYEDIFGGDFIKSISESYGLGYNGRALRILEKFTKDKKPYDYFLRDNQCGDRIKSLHHFHVDMDENLIPPSCNGFRANIFDLCSGGLNSDKYIYFTSVINNGLEELFKKAKDLGFIPKSEGYASKCALCFDMKKYICENIKAKTGLEPVDIGPAGFFTES